MREARRRKPASYEDGITRHAMRRRGQGSPESADEGRLAAGFGGVVASWRQNLLRSCLYYFVFVLRLLVRAKDVGNVPHHSYREYRHRD
jgi:hypothetical protein